MHETLSSSRWSDLAREDLNSISLVCLLSSHRITNRRGWMAFASELLWFQRRHKFDGCRLLCYCFQCLCNLLFLICCNILHLRDVIKLLHQKICSSCSFHKWLLLGLEMLRLYMQQKLRSCFIARRARVWPDFILDPINFFLYLCNSWVFNHFLQFLKLHCVSLQTQLVNFTSVLRLLRWHGSLLRGSVSLFFLSLCL